MTIADLVLERQPQWTELEEMCAEMEHRGRLKRGSAGAARFAALYRAACADLALASAYQLPPRTVAYLHQLVARGHNQLYRSQSFQWHRWTEVVIRDAPQQIFRDPCVKLCAVLFFGLFTLSMILAWSETVAPQYAEKIIGQDQMEQLEDMYEESIEGNVEHYVMMSSFYIKHNTGIGLACFGSGILILPCLFNLSFQAVVLGASFGYMARDSVASGDNFLHFVTAHGPFELTAIVLSAAAGLRIGIGWVFTGGLTRVDSLRLNAVRAIPVMSAAAILFFLAAFTEGFISPSPLPYAIKALWAILSSALMMFYFVVLGFPSQRHSDAT